MTMYKLLLLLIMFFSLSSKAQKSMSITAIPADAEIYLKSGAKEEKIGKGTEEL